jgi:hypothetical protein
MSTEPKSLRQLFSGPSKWCKNSNARDANDRAVAWDSPNAVKFCFIGGLYRVYEDSNKRRKVVEKIKKAINKFHKDDDNIVWISAFNDNPKTSFSDIKKVIELAKV